MKETKNVRFGNMNIPVPVFPPSRPRRVRQKTRGDEIREETENVLATSGADAAREFLNTLLENHEGDAELEAIVADVKDALKL